MTQPNKPIIIVGTGACGSTVFHRLLARHPSVMQENLPRYGHEAGRSAREIPVAVGC